MFSSFKMAAQSSENELEFPFNTSREFELRLGSSFHSKGGPKTAFHTIRCELTYLSLSILFRETKPFFSCALTIDYIFKL